MLNEIFRFSIDDIVGEPSNICRKDRVLANETTLNGKIFTVYEELFLILNRVTKYHVIKT